MVERSMLDPQEIAGTVRHSVPSGQQHRNAVQVGDNDTSVMPPVKEQVTTPYDSQVDDTAIEYLDGSRDMYPRTIHEQAQAGGYAQEGDQSFPASGPRVMASGRGSHDIAATPETPTDTVV